MNHEESTTCDICEAVNEHSQPPSDSLSASSTEDAHAACFQDHLEQAGICFDVTVGASSLALDLNLSTRRVESILPGGQGERLQIRVGDKLMAVNGDALVETETLGARLKEMPRPAVLTFSR